MSKAGKKWYRKPIFPRPPLFYSYFSIYPLGTSEKSSPCIIFCDKTHRNDPQPKCIWHLHEDAANPCGKSLLLEKRPLSSLWFIASMVRFPKRMSMHLTYLILRGKVAWVHIANFNWNWRNFRKDASSSVKWKHHQRDFGGKPNPHDYQ